MNQTDQNGSTSLRREPGSARRAMWRLAVMLAVVLAIYVAEKKGWLPSSGKPSSTTPATDNRSSAAPEGSAESGEGGAGRKSREPITIGSATDDAAPSERAPTERAPADRAAEGRSTDPEPQDRERSVTSSKTGTSPAAKSPASPAATSPAATSPAATSPAPAATRSTIIRGQTIRDEDGNIVYQGDVDVSPTLARIRRGESFPHRNDGSVFQNREGRLPRKPNGYYTEYVHPTPKLRGPGPQRIVLGKEQECYYTPDHYRSFQRLSVRE